MTQTATLQELFDGVRLGALQSAGIMQVLPLLSDEDDDRFASPRDATVSTLSYGSLHFDNGSDKTLLVPCHTGYLVKQRAQNHAMAHTGLVPGLSMHTFDTAMCTQSNQGGTISEGKHKMMILPHPLREVALKIRSDQDYSKLWGPISTFNARFGLREQGHLEYFLKHFSDELDTFVAQFEPVPDQVGAVIFVDGRAVGIERVPSRAFFKTVWGPLIRECYGSLAISEAERLRAAGESTGQGFVLSSEGVETLEGLALAVKQAEARSRAASRKAVGELGRLKVKLTPESVEGVEGVSLVTAEGGAFIGQLVCDEKRVLYASMIARASWFQSRSRLLAA